MKFSKYLLALLLLVPVYSACAASGDTLLLYSNSPNRQYFDLSVCDTFRAFDTLCLTSNEVHCDTGIAPTTGTKYLDYNYHLVKGYAGFKIDWDQGTSSWNFADSTNKLCFDSLVIQHKGPLPNEIVTIWFGRNTGCGTPTVFQKIGTFPSSTAWVNTSIPLTIPDSMCDGNYEMQMRINPVNGDANYTGPVANLKIGTILAVKKSSNGIVYHNRMLTSANNLRYFTPSVSGNVVLSGYSLNGALLFKKTVNVIAGTTYSTGKIISSYASSMSSQMHLVQIKGAGVNCMHKVW